MGQITEGFELSKLDNLKSLTLLIGYLSDGEESLERVTMQIVKTPLTFFFFSKDGYIKTMKVVEHLNYKTCFNTI